MNAEHKIDAEALKSMMGYEREADCRKALESQGIAVFDGRNGIWTTWELIKVAGMSKMGLIKPETQTDKYL